MPRYKKTKISIEVLQKLKEKITNKVTGNIKSMVVRKCKEIFEQKTRNSPEQVGPLCHFPRNCLTSKLLSSSSNRIPKN